MSLSRRLRRGVLLLAAGALILAPGCGRERGPGRVLLISIDTCRADHLGCYGYPGGTTPNLDALAGESLLFTRAVSPVPLTFPSHCSMLTGTYPIYHGVHDNLHYRLSDSLTTLAECFRDAGYRTGAIVGSIVLDSQFNLDQGFETYDDSYPVSTDPRELSERRAGEVSDLAVRWLEAHPKEPFFLFLHYYDPHEQYDPPEPFASTFAGDPYAGEIAYTDSCIGRVIEALKRLHLYDSTTLVVTADHGEALGEHGEPTHDFFIYQSTLRVPLLLKRTGSGQAARRDDAVSLIDIAPTLLRLSGLPVPPEMGGRDLTAPPAKDEGEGNGRVLYCGSLLPTIYGCNPLLGVVAGGWKYILTTRPELYDLDTDPNEQVDRIEDEPRRAAILRGELENLVGAQLRTAGEEGRITPDAQTREAIQSLGYVAGQPVSETVKIDPARPDPKDRIGYHVDYTRALRLIRGGDREEARALCDTMLARHPDVPATYLLLGDIESADGRLRPAAEQYATYLDRTRSELARPGAAADRLRLTTNQFQAAFQLANALADLGETDEAVRRYRQAMALDPRSIEAPFNLGVTLAEAGRFDPAIEEFFGVLEREPAYVDARFNLGRALAEQGRRQEAIAQFEQVVGSRPDHVTARLALGDLLGQEGRWQEAASQYLEALKRAPGSPEPEYKLARALLGIGETERAVAIYREALRRFPKSAEIAGGLALVLATDEDARFRDATEAIELARTACHLSGQNDPIFLRTLAAAYAEAGRFDDARATEEKALSLAESQGRKELASRIRERLRDYRAGKPVRTRFSAGS